MREWVRSARHPTFKRPYTELTFAPMREVLAYLRANGFKVWIVSTSAPSKSMPMHCRPV